MVKLVFNEFDSSCQINGKLVKLSPNSFKLLRLLNTTDHVPVCFTALRDSMWVDQPMPEYSVKQVAKSLQKELSAAQIDKISVVLVEDVGYAIKVKTSSRGHFLAAFLAMALIIFLFINVISPMARSGSMINNRVAFIPQMTDTADNVIYNEAIYQMRYHLAQSDIIFLLSSSNKNSISNGLSGKYSNIGLLIEWFSASNAVENVVVMEIIEPTTKTLLSSVELNIDDFTALDKQLSQQVISIERLLTSELLPLTEDALENPYDPIWNELKLLLSATEMANSKG